MPTGKLVLTADVAQTHGHTHRRTDGYGCGFGSGISVSTWHCIDFGLWFFELQLQAQWNGSKRAETKRNQPEAEMDEMAALPFAFFAF